MAKDFSKGSVGKNIIYQAVPLIMAQLVQLLYSVVDRVYIGHLPAADNMALTGIGITFPIVTLIAAFTNLFGQGGTPLFSIERGAGNEKTASKILGNTFTMLIVTALFLMAFGYTFKKPVLYAFGASDNSYVYANQYLNVYLLGTVFSMISAGMNGFINAQGYPKIGMVTTMAGAVANLILDPIFIFLLNMGVSGAALATIISQFISMIWVLHFFLSGKSSYKLNFENMKPDFPLIGRIAELGTSGFVVQATNSLVQIVCNKTLQTYSGDLYVGIMTILNSVRELANLPVHGITSGCQPVIGYNYGAKEYNRVKQGIRFTVFLGVTYTLFFWLITRMFPVQLIKIFTNDQMVLLKGPETLNIYFFGFFFMAFQFCGQSTFQALGYAKHAIFFSLFRKVIIVVPLTILLPRLGYGVNGVFLAEPISNLIGGLACFITMYICVYRKLGKNITNN